MKMLLKQVGIVFRRPQLKLSGLSLNGGRMCKLFAAVEVLNSLSPATGDVERLFS